ncbi:MULTISPECIES: hypothetical protein [Elizabethkingia]|uniref:hypothetical protein n=1 Tax=Elizabethkingia TaxID=308865 RepID=UPI0021A8D9BD|nr:hypothetical protein [Elizabethkingia sp. HX CGY]MCT3689527.1 hypothetical protein [Elizabethkingia anophelis]MCT3706384.1 hypothetical protein [Elizabethkingia anophelis]MCT3713403.1 hypothetical protein [Elizabethkingia anophelis]MCT3716821.1 hypothetical protein [Elizabethkingia anophelis]MCT3730420.1 hypothetical protein [Elizabethkingia anophelis]
MKDDLYIIYLLRHKKRLTLIDKINLWWLKRSYPSYEDNDKIKYELYKRRYINDLSGYESEQDEYGGWKERPESIPEIIQTTVLGERAIYSKELKSEKTEHFFDKTIVRWGLLISGIYGIFSFLIDVFRYFINHFVK